LPLKSVPETAGKVVDGSIRMTRGTECKYSPTEVNCLIQVRQNTSLLKTDPETVREVVKGHRSIRMTRRMECKCSSMKLNCLIYLRHDTTDKSVPETRGKVTERLGWIRMTRWMEHNCY